MTTRPPAVAGTFYPDDPVILRSLVRELLNDAPPDGPPDEPAPKLLIAPHAGYAYSGPVAATGYVTLETQREVIERVVLLGPAHRMYFQGVALSTADKFASPLGAITLDTGQIDYLRGLDGIVDNDDAHRAEHSLEVHLPFLQQTLKNFQLIPLLVGDATRELVCNLIELLWGGPETLILVSTDLSHFLDYESARRVDAVTSVAIEQAQSNLTPEQACGCRPLNGALKVVRDKQLNIRTLDVRNSGDTAGGRERVVGYGTYIAA